MYWPLINKHKYHKLAHTQLIVPRQNHSSLTWEKFGTLTVLRIDNG